MKRRLAAINAWIAKRVHPAAAWLVVALLVVGLALPDRRNPEAWIFAFAWFSLFLQVFLHELGHFVAALAVGYPPRTFAAGPLAIRFVNGRPRPALNRLWSHGHFFFFRPKRSRAKDMAVTAAGPLANLGTTAGLLLLPQESRPLLEIFLLCMGFIGGFIFLLSALPLPRPARGLPTDGRQILDWLRGKDAQPLAPEMLDFPDAIQ